MNCAVCGTPKKADEYACFFCGAKFPESNIEQKEENYNDDVVSFDDLFTEEKKVELPVGDVSLLEENVGSEDSAYTDLDFDNILSELENNKSGILENLENLEEVKETSEKVIEEELFDFSFDDLDNIEKSISKDNDEDFFSLEDIELLSEESKSMEDNEVEEIETLEAEDAEEVEEIETLEVENAEEVEEIETLEAENAEEVEEIETLEVENAEEVEEIETLEVENAEEVEEIETLEVENTIETKKILKKSKAENRNQFEFSLDDLDNIEKNLTKDRSKTNSVLSALEQALLSGEDLGNFNVKEVLSSKQEESEEAEIDFFEEAEIDKIRPTVKGKIAGLISEELFQQIDIGLKAKEKGEPLPSFITQKEVDVDIDAMLSNIVNSIKLLKMELDTKEELGEELFELEQMLLSRDEEVAVKTNHVIEDIEDIEDIDFVDVEEVDSDENLLKNTDEVDIETNIANIVENFRQKAESGEEGLEALAEAEKERIEKLALAEEEALKRAEEEALEKLKDLDELDLISEEIIKAKERKDDNDLRAALIEEADSNIEELDDLISNIIGDIQEEDITSSVEIEEEEEEEEEEEDLTPQPMYDKELVEEYETLRLDLELFFPGTQELDKLDKDIAILMNNTDETDELLHGIDMEELGIDFEGFDFEELTDRDISDALLDIRDMKGQKQKRRLEEKNRKRRARRKKIYKIFTIDGRIKAYDTVILFICLVTAVALGTAWTSTIATRNLSVNVRSKSEQLRVAENLWDALNDISTKYSVTQKSVESYIAGDIGINIITFELSNFVDEVVVTREKFETVDIPTYSEYKYKIDQFLSTRMILADAALNDIMAGKINTPAIEEFLSLQNNFDSLEREKEKEVFYKELNLN